MSLVLLYNPAATGGGTDAYVEPVSAYGFNQVKDVVVRVQALDGSWETCGADTARGITPEKVQLVSDQWGSKTASFDLRRDPKALWPDIGAFAPVDIEVGGRPVWSGRVLETPVRDSTDSVISVQCEGWQAHLDDDLYERIYVHTNLSDWKDMRSFPGAVLGSTNLTAAGQVAQDNALTLMWPSGTVMAQFDKVGVQLDLGPQSTGKRVVVDFTTSNNNANMYFAAFASDTDYLGNFESSTTQAINVASGTLAFTYTTAKRYISLILQPSTAQTVAADVWVRANSIQVFADTAYESGNASKLRADVVIKDALDRATVMLDADRTQIESGTFSIPELAPSEPTSPRQIWGAVNAFEDYQAKIDVLKRPVFKAKPTAPELEVGAWSGMEFEDSSANSGADIYSRVIVTGAQPNGLPLRVFRTQAQLANSGAPAVQRISGDGGGGIGILGASSPTPANPSFVTNTTDWTATSSTITRTTATFQSTPASGRWDATGASDALAVGAKLTGNINGDFQAGVTYRIVMSVRPGTFSGVGAPCVINLEFGTANDYGRHALYLTGASASFSEISFDWTPLRSISSGVTVRLTNQGNPTYGSGVAFIWVDSLRIDRATTTLVERRGFLRSKILNTSFMLTESAAQQLADKWLAGRRSTPFKGRAKLSGNNAVRDITSGRPVPVEELLLRTGELVRFSDRIDPDTGATGRDGRLVEVQYSADSDTVDITLDNSRAGFEALLERLGVVLGQNRS